MKLGRSLESGIECEIIRDREKIPDRPLPNRDSDKISVRYSKPGLFRKLNFQGQQSIGFLGGPARRRQRRRIQVWSFCAACLDFFLILSISALFIFAAGSLLKIFYGGQSALTILPAGIMRKSWVRLCFGAVFFLQYFIYLLGMRFLFGKTLGEFVCQLQLGSLRQKSQPSYIFRVGLRTFLMFVTGGVLIPLLSWAVGQDIAGSWTGLRLQQVND